MTSGVVGAFGNAMFGGEFNLSAKVEASSIDVAILSSVVDGFLDYLSRYPFPRKSKAGTACDVPGGAGVAHKQKSDGRPRENVLRPLS